MDEITIPLPDDPSGHVLLDMSDALRRAIVDYRDHSMRSRGYRGGWSSAAAVAVLQELHDRLQAEGERVNLAFFSAGGGYHDEPRRPRPVCSFCGVAHVGSCTRARA